MLQTIKCTQDNVCQFLMHPQSTVIEITITITITGGGICELSSPI